MSVSVTSVRPTALVPALAAVNVRPLSTPAPLAPGSAPDVVHDSVTASVVTTGGRQDTVRPVELRNVPFCAVSNASTPSSNVTVSV